MVDYAVIAICAVLGEYLIPECRCHHQDSRACPDWRRFQSAGGGVLYKYLTLYPFWQHEATTNDTGLLLTLGLWGNRTSDYCLTLPHRIGLRVGVDFIDTMDRYTYYLRYSVATVYTERTLYTINYCPFPEVVHLEYSVHPNASLYLLCCSEDAAWCYNGKYLTVL